MSVAFSNSVQVIGNSTGVTTRASPSISVTINNLVVLAVGGASSTITISSVSDAIGGLTWNQGTSCRQTNGTDFTDIWWAVCNSTTSGAITAHYSSSLTFDIVEVTQWTGNDTVSPFETGGGATGVGTTLTTASFSPANSGNGVLVFARNPGGGVTAWAQGTNYTLRDSSISGVEYAVETRDNAPSGSQTGTLTWTTAATVYGSFATFKQASSSGHYLSSLGVGA